MARKKKEEELTDEVLKDKKEKTPRKRRTKEEIELEKNKKKEVEPIEETKEKEKKKPKDKTKKKEEEVKKETKSKVKEEKVQITKYQKTICEKCDDLVDYNIVFGSKSEIVDNVRITYNALICSCEKCGAIVDPLNIYEINQKSFDKEYRKKMGILQQDEIINLITKSKKTMIEISHLTGLDDFIISSYMQGLRPLKENSDILEEKLSRKISTSQ